MRRHHAQAASRTASEPNLLPTRPLTALLLADGKPGHYHQAEGVIAAIGRLRPVTTVRLEVRRRFVVPTRTLAAARQPRRLPGADPAPGLRHPRGSLPAADVVVSAGGETLAANAAAAKLLGAPNIFCGRLRRLGARAYEARHRLAGALRPSCPTISSPCRPRRSTRRAALPQRRPREALRARQSARPGRRADRRQLRRPPLRRGGLAAAHPVSCSDAHRAHGIRWLAATSRRSGSFIGDALAAMAARERERARDVHRLPHRGRRHAAADLCRRRRHPVHRQLHHHDLGGRRRLPARGVGGTCGDRAGGARGRVPRLPRQRGLVSLAAAVAADARHASWPRWRRSRRAPAASWTSWRRP